MAPLRIKKRKAVALLEMAIVLPLLLILIFGVIEYGWMFLKAQQLTNAARQGARIGARPDATNADILQTVSETLSDAGFSGTYTVTVTPSDVTALEPGQSLEVSVSAPYVTLQITSLPLLPMPDQLSSQTTMAREGP